MTKLEQKKKFEELKTAYWFIKKQNSKDRGVISLRLNTYSQLLKAATLQ